MENTPTSCHINSDSVMHNSYSDGKLCFMRRFPGKMPFVPVLNMMITEKQQLERLL